jgi:hypothetical protein
MAMSLAGLGPDNDCAGDGQQQLERTDPSSRQRGHPTSTNWKLSDRTKKSGRGPQTGRMAVGRNITLTLTCELLRQLETS